MYLDGFRKTNRLLKSKQTTQLFVSPPFVGPLFLAPLLYLHSTSYHMSIQPVLTASKPNLFLRRVNQNSKQVCAWFVYLLPPCRAFVSIQAVPHKTAKLVNLTSSSEGLIKIPSSLHLDLIFLRPPPVCRALCHIYRYIYIYLCGLDGDLALLLLLAAESVDRRLFVFNFRLTDGRNETKQKQSHEIKLISTLIVHTYVLVCVILVLLVVAGIL